MIKVMLPHNLFYVLIADILAKLGKRLLDVLLGNLARFINVESFEQSFNFPLRQELVNINGSR